MLFPWLVYAQLNLSDAHVFYALIFYVLPPHSLLAVSYDLRGVSQTSHSQTVQTARLCMNVASRMRV